MTGGRKSATLTDRDRSIVDQVDPYLEDGLAVYKWWQRTHKINAYADRFELRYQRKRPDTCFGFFDETTVGGSNCALLLIVLSKIKGSDKRNGSIRIDLHRQQSVANRTHVEGDPPHR